MISRLITGLLLFLAAACTPATPPSLPLLAPAASSADQSRDTGPCLAVYPRGSWQFTHHIEFTLAKGGTDSVLGVTVLNARGIRCALLTVEGLTLFELQQTDDRTEVVLRAVPPFDRPGFANGLLADIRALFRQPPCRDIRYGHLPDGTPCCRLSGKNGQTTDILAASGDSWQIRTYGPDHTLIRKITAREYRCFDNLLLPRKLTLTVPGSSGYILHLTLVDAVHISRSKAKDTNTKCDLN